MRGTIWGLMAGCVLLLSASVPSAAAPSYDLVILHGRIMDPETGTDRIANLGVRAGRIAAISDHVLTGARTIDAKGLVVSLTPPARMEPVNGTATVKVLWRPRPPCKP